MLPLISISTFGVHNHVITPNFPVYSMSVPYPKTLQVEFIDYLYLRFDSPLTLSPRPPTTVILHEFLFNLSRQMKFNLPVTVPTIELYFYLSGVTTSPFFPSSPVISTPSTWSSGLLSLHSDLWANNYPSYWVILRQKLFFCLQETPLLLELQRTETSRPVMFLNETSDLLGLSGTEKKRTLKVCSCGDQILVS